MVDVIMWTAIIGTGLAAIVFLILFALILAALFNYIRGETNNHSLPPPERVAERMYGQQYFERAVKKD